MKIEIGGHVRALRRYQPSDYYEAQVIITADGDEIEFVIPTGSDDPTQAVEFARAWLVSFGSSVANEFAQKGSLQ